jgi:hypothetical protein
MSSLARKPAQLAIIILMLLAGMMLWLGDPLIWIWIGSQVTESQQGGMGPYMLVAFGILASTVVVAYALLRLNRLYERVSGETKTVRVRLPWMRSLRDESGRETEMTVFDAVLVATALMALTAFALWFFLIAGSPLPRG